MNGFMWLDSLPANISHPFPQDRDYNRGYDHAHLAWLLHCHIRISVYPSKCSNESRRTFFYMARQDQVRVDLCYFGHSYRSSSNI